VPASDVDPADDEAVGPDARRGRGHGIAVAEEAVEHCISPSEEDGDVVTRSRGS
jgi:hypothetical protein